MATPVRSALAVVFLASSLVPIAWAMEPPQWIDDEYRTCVGDAIEREMDERIDAQREYGDAQVRDLETYRDALSRAYDIVDDDARKDAVRDADRAYRDDTRESKREFDARVREARDDSRQVQRDCRDRARDHENFVDDICVTTDDCRRNQVCTTETGACEPSCPDDAQSCVQQCAGTCVRSSSSRSSSSRSSSSRSSSSRSSSSRSSSSPSSGGTGGVNCQPYVCTDGREVPSCTPEGHPINYFQNPCYN